MTNLFLCLPGFMGTGVDFLSLRRSMKVPDEPSPWQWPNAEPCQNIADYAELCWLLFLPKITAPFYLYAYSLGGRVAMHWLHKPEFITHCLGVFIASAHTGLTDPTLRYERQVSDYKWVGLFQNSTLSHTLTQWYQQPVFQTLTDQQKRELIAKKSRQNRTLLANQLMVASLSKQRDLQNDLKNCPVAHYVVGDQDEKFFALSQQFCPPVNRLVMTDAGHVIHIEQPLQLATALINIIEFGDAKHDRNTADEPKP